jgi:DUF1016 N-terminal domain
MAKNYVRLVSEISDLLEQSRRAAARSVNALLTATYWEIERPTVEYEQGGKSRAGYGEELMARLSKDLMVKHGRGFSRQGLQKMRAFYLGWEICPTPSGKFEARSMSDTVGRKRSQKTADTVCRIREIARAGSNFGSTGIRPGGLLPIDGSGEPTGPRKSYQIVEGSSNIQKMIIAQNALGYRKANR